MLCVLNFQHGMSNLRFFIEPLSDGLYFGTTD